MNKKIGNWKIEDEWDINGTWAVRYYNSTSKPRKYWNLQISKYRDADDFDKAMKHNYEWHGKWYVIIWGDTEITKLFNTKTEAVSYAKKYMETH